jgi:hypothetical protein
MVLMQQRRPSPAVAEKGRKGATRGVSRGLIWHFKSICAVWMGDAVEAAEAIVSDVSKILSPEKSTGQYLR